MSEKENAKEIIENIVKIYNSTSDKELAKKILNLLNMLRSGIDLKKVITYIRHQLENSTKLGMSEAKSRIYTNVWNQILFMFQRRDF